MPAARIDSRRKRLAETRQRQRERWKADLEKAKGEVPIHPAWFTHCLNQVKGPDDIIIKESPIAWEQLDMTKPGTFFSIGAGGTVHNGETKLLAFDQTDKALGSRVLFHFPLEIGYRFDGHNSLSVYFEHMSNGYTRDENEGLDRLGVRYGYRF